jgi:hypothetical protein
LGETLVNQIIKFNTIKPDADITTLQRRVGLND